MSERGVVTLLSLMPQEQLARLLGVTMQEVFELRAGTGDELVARRLDYLILLLGSLIEGGMSAPGAVYWLYQPQPVCGGRVPASLLGGDWDPDDTVSRALMRQARALGANGAVAD